MGDVAGAAELLVRLAGRGEGGAPRCVEGGGRVWDGEREPGVSEPCVLLQTAAVASVVGGSMTLMEPLFSRQLRRSRAGRAVRVGVLGVLCVA